MNSFISSLSVLKNKNIGIAVSGGIDSMVLLDLLYLASKKLNFSFCVIHYNHNWRKKSIEDYKLIASVCKRKKIKLFYGENTTGIINNEEIARQQRYSFFEQVAKLEHLNYICTAHHLDDFIETILFRLLRGTGPNGLAPIKEYFYYSKDLVVFRPLLNFSKDELIKYSIDNKIKFLNDETNKDLSYKRNLIREKIIPLLKEVNPAFVNNLLDFSDLVYSQSSALTDYINELKGLIVAKDFNHIEIDKKIFLSLSDYYQKSIIYWMMSKINVKGSLSRINEILVSIKQNKKISLSKDIFLISSEDIIYLGPKKINKQDNYKIVIRKAKLNEFKNIFPKDSTGTAFVDLSIYNLKDLKIRTRSSQDIFQPLGISRVVKLKNYLINKKISREERYNLPLLCYKNEVLWIPGYSISEKIKVKKNPSHFLKLIVER